MVQTLNGSTPNAEQAQGYHEQLMEKLFAAGQAGAVFGEPVASGAYTVITASEVASGGAFGFGSGSAPVQAPRTAEDGRDSGIAAGGGAGGGGGATGRPVAAIIIGPDGVKVQPVADATKIALAAIAAWVSVAVMAMRLARARKRRR